MLYLCPTGLQLFSVNCLDPLSQRVRWHIGSQHDQNVLVPLNTFSFWCLSFGRWICARAEFEFDFSQIL